MRDGRLRSGHPFIKRFLGFHEQCVDILARSPQSPSIVVAWGYCSTQAFYIFPARKKVFKKSKFSTNSITILALRFDFDENLIKK